MAIELTKEQKLAVQKTDGRICVAAGAGSGKTRVLVERIIALLEAKKATPRQLLAVTFTNKAAGEMKERLRSQVEEKIRQANSSIDRQFWEAVLDDLPMAIIGTIHGFCSRVLRTHPVESGRDPSFRVADEAEATLLVQQAVNNVLEKSLRDKEPEIMQLCAAFKLRIVHTQLMSLWREKNRLPLMSPAFGEWSYIDEPELTTLVNETWARLLSSATTAKQKDGLAQAEQQLPPVSALTDALWREETAAGSMLGRVKTITASGKIKEPLQTLRSLLETIRSVWAEKKTGKFNQTFFQLLSRVRENVRKRQLRENILFFDDLEQEAIRLFSDYPEVRRRWQDRFAYIMVDEFQDTNKSQLTLLNFLDDGRKNGNFFFVGDEKQSIYRFRGAQVEVFRRERDDLPQERQLQLVKNFRSEPAVLTNVNIFFENLYRAMGQSDFMALDAGRIGNGVTSATRFCLTEEEPENGREAEAHWIAEQLKQLVARQTVCEEDGPINYGDCALLFRSGLRMSLFAEQLRSAGVPCTIVGGSGFYEHQEVQDMLMLLGVLDNRFRALELVGVLRSPLFGLTDETVLLLTQNGPLWETLLSAEQLTWLTGDQRDLVFRAKRILFKLHQAIRWLSPQQLAEQILMETEAATWLAAGEKGAETLANVDKLFAKMIQYCQNSGTGIGAFLAYVEACRSVNIREASVQTDSSESVQLMTIHKAKGLEFAVVVLPEMDAHFPTKLPDVLVSDDGIMGFSAQVGDATASTLTQQRLAQQYRQAEKEEAARVLYVAMTRAKERLFLTGQCPKNITENYQEKAKAKTIDETASWLDWLLAFWPQPIEKQQVVTADCADMATDIHGEANSVRSRQAAFPLAMPMLSERPAIIELSATALHTYCLCPRWFYYQYRAEMPELRSEEAGGDGGVDARELGLLAHKTLELAAKGVDVASAISEALRIMPEAAAHERLVRDMSARFLDTDFGYQLIQGRVMTETPFVFEFPLFENCQARFRGFIDYLVKNDDDQYSVLDYKTNLLANESGLKKASAYEHQLMLYTLAVEADYGPVAQACLYFLRSGEMVKIDIHQERKRLVDEILSIGRAIADSRTERDFAVNQTNCRLCPFSGFCRRS